MNSILRIFWIGILLMSVCPLSAQNSATLNGVLQDSITREGVVGAVIVLPKTASLSHDFVRSSSSKNFLKKLKFAFGLFFCFHFLFQQRNLFFNLLPHCIIGECFF